MIPSTDAFFTELRARFKLAQDHETSVRQHALDDLKFRSGQQWPESIQKMRMADNRPCLTINRIPHFLHQVTNEIRQNRPSADVSPVEGGDIETAETFQGIYNHICRQSNAPAVRAYAADYGISIGFGYYRLVTEYSDPLSMDQDIFIRRIRNPFTVYMDPSAEMADKSDAQWGFIIDNYPLDEYHRLWPDSEVTDGLSLSGIGDQTPTWVTSAGIQVAEYFYIQYERKTLSILENGMSTTENVPAGIPIIAQRKTEVPTVHWCKTNGLEKLEETIWPGRYIPIISVIGEEYDIDGEPFVSGMIRNAKDPARMYNYWATAETEMIALAPKAPWVVAQGQIEGFENEWKTSNVRNHAVLHYKPMALGEKLVPPPQRISVEPPIQSISQARLMAADDLKATMGLFDASLGARSNETSGRAILARQQEGDTGNFHYIDAVHIAIQHEARMIVDLIPKIYDRPGRVARIIGDDGKSKSVTLNAPFEENGAQKIFDLGAGRYDVAITVGPSYTTKRKETAESMVRISEAYPPLWEKAGDMIVKTMDWPNAQELAKRLAPPGVQDDGEENPIPPEVQQQMAEMNQMIQVLADERDQLIEKLNTKATETEGKMRIAAMQADSKEQIEALKAQVELIKLQSQEDTTLLQADMQRIQTEIAQLAAQDKQAAATAQ